MLRISFQAVCLLVLSLALPRASVCQESTRSVGQNYVIVWDFDATKAIRTATGEILIPLPSEEPYQKVRWEVSGVLSQRLIVAEGGRLAAVRPLGPSIRLRIAVEPTGTEITRPRDKKLPIPAEALACFRGNAAFAALNPRTAALARELQAKDPLQTVQNIRGWLKENITYHYGPANRRDVFGGIDTILERKKGDCGSYSYLFASLCRQAGVPARVVWGPVKIAGMGPLPKETGLPENLAEMGDFCGHCWSEVYIKDWGWIPLEPQPNQLRLGQVFPTSHVPFLRLDPYWTRTNKTLIAQGNVWLMNYLAKLEETK